MPLAHSLADFKTSAAQCDSLIANAHQANPTTSFPILPPIDRQQITVAAFLNLFIAWETFIEGSLHELMTGGATLSGKRPIKYVSPADEAAARALVAGVGRAYFDYGNHNLLKPLVRMYFNKGYPYEPCLSASEQDFADIRTMRHAAAHITSNTQTALEGLATRVLRKPAIGITLYDLLMSSDPTSPTGATIYATYRDKLIVAADLIANG